MAQFHLGAVYLNMSVPVLGRARGAVHPARASTWARRSAAAMPRGVRRRPRSPVAVADDVPATRRRNGEPRRRSRRVADEWRRQRHRRSSARPRHGRHGVEERPDFPFSATVTIGPNRQVPVHEPGDARLEPDLPPAHRQPDPGQSHAVQRRHARRARRSAADVRRRRLRRRSRPAATAATSSPTRQRGVGGAFFKGVTSTAPYQFTYTAAQ